MAAMKRVPARDKDVYAALAESWRAAFIDGTGDKATAVGNWTYLPKNGTWLVHWGPCPFTGADGKAWKFADDAREYTSDELRDLLELAPKTRRVSSGPSKAQVLAAALKLAELVDDIPADVAAVLFPAGGKPVRHLQAVA